VRGIVLVGGILVYLALVWPLLAPVVWSWVHILLRTWLHVEETENVCDSRGVEIDVFDETLIAWYYWTFHYLGCMGITTIEAMEAVASS
jgi:hypothetical protein